MSLSFFGSQPLCETVKVDSSLSRKTCALKKTFNEISEASTHCKGSGWGFFLERKEGIPNRWSVVHEKVTPDLGLAEGGLSPPCYLHILHRKNLEQIWIQEKGR
jgi:hypothetical protein